MIGSRDDLFVLQGSRGHRCQESLVSLLGLFSVDGGCPPESIGELLSEVPEFVVRHRVSKM